MKTSRIPALLAVSALVLVACGQGTENADGGVARNAVITRNWRVDVPAAQIGANSQYQAVTVTPDGAIYAAAQSSAAYKGAVIGGTDVVLTRFGADGTEAWSRRFGTPAADSPSAMASDANLGRVYVAGATSGNIGTAPNGQDVFVKGFDAAGNDVFTWQKSASEDQTVTGLAVDETTSTLLLGFRNAAKTTGGVYRIWNDGRSELVMSTSTDLVGSIASDADGSFVVASTRTVTTSTATATSPEKNTYVTSYSANGGTEWSRVLDFTAPSKAGTVDSAFSDDVPTEVAVAADGTVLVIGHVSAVGVTTPEQAFVTSIGLDGVIRWTRMLSALEIPVSPSVPATYVHNVVPTANGEIWVTGESNQTFDVDYSSQWLSPFAFKFSASGGQLALRHETPNGANQVVRDAAAQADTNQLVEVLASGGTSILSLADNPAEPIVDGADIVQQFGTVGFDSAKDIAAGPDGEYFMIGSFAENALGANYTGTGDRLIAQIAPKGWEAQVYVDGIRAGIDHIIVTPDGGVAAAGSLYLNSNGTPSRDVWVGKWTRDGVRTWLTRETVAGSQGVSGIAAEPDGSIAMTGVTDTLFADGLATKSTAFLSRYSGANGVRQSVTQWGGVNSTAPSAPVPVAPGEFVIASFELDPTQSSGRGNVSVARMRADGTVVTQGEKNPTVSFEGHRIAAAPDGTFVVGDVVPVAVGETTTTQVHLTGYSAAMARTFEVTLPKQGRLHRNCLSDIAVKSSGEILVVGTAQCTPAPATFTRNNGMFLRVSPAGQIIEAKSLAKSLYDTQTAVAVGPYDDVWIAGTMVTLVSDGAPGTGDVLVRRYPGARPQGVTTTTLPVSNTVGTTSTTLAPTTTTTLAPVVTTVAPATTVASATTVAPSTTVRPAVTTTFPPATVPPTTAPVTNTTVATPPAGTTVVTVPVELDKTADAVTGDKSGFSVELGGKTVTGTVTDSGAISVTAPAGAPAGKPFVSGLVPDHRSVSVKWAAVPGAKSYSVTASGGRLQSCSSVSTSCTVTGLLPGYPYQFVVTAFGNQSAASDPSVPVKPVLYLGRLRSISGGRVLPVPTDRKTKVSWKAKGACSVSTKGLVKAGKKKGTCTVTRRTTKTKLSPATTITFTVLVR